MYPEFHILRVIRDHDSILTCIGSFLVLSPADGNIRRLAIAASFFPPLLRERRWPIYSQSNPDEVVGYVVYIG